jgi:hypothetical protein
MPVLGGGWMSYLKTYSLGSLIRSALAIHFRNWLTLSLIFAIAFVPTVALQATVLEVSNSKILFGLSKALEFVAGLFAVYPITVVVSEICLGLRPSVLRAYRRAFAHPGRLFGTVLLSSLIIILGIIALVIPGIVFVVWYLFVGPVVILEGLGGRAALRRSRELGRDCYWRNFGIGLVVMLMALAMGLIAIVAFFMALLFGAGLLMESAPNIPDPILRVLGAFILAAFLPIYTVAVVLLYYDMHYDMRARKEAYGATQLADDIRF